MEHFNILQRTIQLYPADDEGQYTTQMILPDSDLESSDSEVEREDGDFSDDEDSKRRRYLMISRFKTPLKKEESPDEGDYDVTDGEEEEEDFVTKFRHAERYEKILTIVTKKKTDCEQKEEEGQDPGEEEEAEEVLDVPEENQVQEQQLQHNEDQIETNSGYGSLPPEEKEEIKFIAFGNKPR